MKFIFDYNRLEWVDAIYSPLRSAKNSLVLAPPPPIRSRFILFKIYRRLLFNFANCSFLHPLYRIFHYHPVHAFLDGDTAPIFVFIGNPPFCDDFHCHAWLRRKYPDCKFYRFILRPAFYYSQKTRENVFPRYDKIITFDYNDHKTYGWDYHPNCYSHPANIVPSSVHCDVFFLGKNKNRLAQLLHIYDYLTSCGLSCYFIITEVPVEKRQKRDGILYYDGVFPYLDYLRYVISCKALLEIVQERQVGNTLRACEAIAFGKFLITNTDAICQQSCCEPSNVAVFQDISDVSPEFLSAIQTQTAVYPHADELSPLHFLKWLETIS